MNPTGKFIQAVPRFGGATSRDDKGRIFAETIDQPAGLIESMLRDALSPEDFSGHIRGLSPYAERD